ncbi:MAG: alcohol dehydrogenase family protein [Lentilitoribacter sp.]
MAIKNRMSAVVLTGHGDFDKLEYRNNFLVPELTPNDVLIRVGAAGVNNTDINTRIGWYSKGDNDSDDASWAGGALKFPHIQGADACGTIVAVGTNIDANRVGERVLVEPCFHEFDSKDLDSAYYYGSETYGAFAEYSRVPSRYAHKIDSPLSDVELASFPCSYSTSENMLTRSGVKEGDCVLITGASGGVGSASIQLAKARGAKVIAVTSPSKVDELVDLGADQTIHRDADYVDVLGENSVDVVIDLVAGPKWPSLLDVLRHKGRYVVSGAIGGPMVELDVRTLYLKDLSFFGCTVIEQEVFGNLIKRIEQGQIKPLVAQTFPLADIVKAQKSFQSKSHIGKIVLTVGE